MRLSFTPLLAGGLALAALAIVPQGALAAPVTFSYTGALQTFTVGTSGTYQIIAYGAQGGGSNVSSGGLGAEAAGTLSLSAGDVLNILVGGQGGSASLSGGGGGGSFVMTTLNAALVVGGGGGGAGFTSGGGSAQIGTSGAAGDTEFFGSDVGGAGGTGGQGGQGGSSSRSFEPGYAGGGGGGLLSAGTAATAPRAGQGGQAATGTAAGGAGSNSGGSGGFGGGGGGAYDAGGGGGGYSGGGGAAGNIGGGGGGSFVTGSALDILFLADARTGNGLVTIELMDSPPVVVPEPASLALFGAGLLGLGMVRRRRS